MYEITAMTHEIAQKSHLGAPSSFSCNEHRIACTRHVCLKVVHENHSDDARNLSEERRVHSAAMNAESRVPGMSVSK